MSLLQSRQFLFSLLFSLWSLRIVYENGTVEGTVPVGESCSGNTGDLEKCERPVIKECIDRNKYCTGPPVVISYVLSFTALYKYQNTGTESNFNINQFIFRNLTQFGRKLFKKEHI